NAERLVEGGRAGLFAPAEDLRQRLHGDTRNIVEWLLCGKRPARCRRMKPEMLRLLCGAAEAGAHEIGPYLAGCPIFRDLFEEVHLRAEMQLDLMAELVHAHALGKTGLDIGDAVADRVGGFR